MKQCGTTQNFKTFFRTVRGALEFSEKLQETDFNHKIPRQEKKSRIKAKHAKCVSSFISWDEKLFNSYL